MVGKQAASHLTRDRHKNILSTLSTLLKYKVMRNEFQVWEAKKQKGKKRKKRKKITEWRQKEAGRTSWHGEIMRGFSSGLKVYGGKRKGLCSPSWVVVNAENKGPVG